MALPLFSIMNPQPNFTIESLQRRLSENGLLVKTNNKSSVSFHKSWCKVGKDPTLSVLMPARGSSTVEYKELWDDCMHAERSKFQSSLNKI